MRERVERENVRIKRERESCNGSSLAAIAAAARAAQRAVS
jgi:predicted nicotinamide N-methyase